MFGILYNVINYFTIIIKYIMRGTKTSNNSFGICEMYENIREVLRFKVFLKVSC